MSIDSAVDALIEFHETFEHPIATSPTLDVGDKTRQLRVDLIAEEFGELVDALDAEDIVEVADALMDLLYVVYGACITFGIPVKECFAEVHRSNMAKAVVVDGKLTTIRSPSGKTMKPEGWTPPDLASILIDHTRKAS